MTWGRVLRKIVEHVLRQHIRKALRHVTAVVGVGAGLAAIDGDPAVRIMRRECLWGGPNREDFPREGNRPVCR